MSVIFKAGYSVLDRTDVRIECVYLYVCSLTEVTKFIVRRRLTNTNVKLFD